MCGLPGIDVYGYTNDRIVRSMIGIFQLSNMSAFICVGVTLIRSWVLGYVVYYEMRVYTAVELFLVVIVYVQ